MGQNSLLTAPRTSHLPPVWRGRCYAEWMRDATIFLAKQYGTRQFAVAMGVELRVLRQSVGLTQAQLADPLTAAYVSAIEGGKVFPSVPALAMLLDRLDVSFAQYFVGVNNRLHPRYTTNRD